MQEYDTQVERLAKNKIGSDSDQWLEVFSPISGNWDRVGLIFGYTDDRGECDKAIAGLRSANPDREYRCTSAN